jgi:catechol 2,3-dioxygenase-like lactoylglutathione lyase family enzyme
VNAPDVARPARLHHHAFVVADQERTREFYEDVIGLPLVETWCEHDEASDYCHTFYELEDGSCLAFFQFAKAEVQADNTRPRPSAYDHVAVKATREVQAAIAARAEIAGVFVLTIDHGYCTSLYVPDPDGLVIEITVDAPEAVDAAPDRRARAHDELARWLAGDHADNNTYRARE